MAVASTMAANLPPIPHVWVTWNLLLGLLHRMSTHMLYATSDAISNLSSIFGFSKQTTSNNINKRCNERKKLTHGYGTASMSCWIPKSHRKSHVKCTESFFERAPKIVEADFQALHGIALTFETNPQHSCWKLENKGQRSDRRSVWYYQPKLLCELYL
jgi:hypothetical protein